MQKRGRCTKFHSGRSPFLNKDEESRLVDWIFGLLNRGAPCISQNIIDAANKVYRDRVLFDAPTLGTGWLQRFKKRNKLDFRTPKIINAASRNNSNSEIKKWFDMVNNYINKTDELAEVLKDKRRIINVNEIFLRFEPSSDRMLAPIGTENVSKETQNDNAGLTVMCSFSADGTARKPFIIYPFKPIPKSIKEKFPHHAAKMTSTQNGWIDSTTFCAFLETLANDLTEGEVPFPVIMYLDTHSSHTTLEAFEKAKQLRIEMIFLNQNSKFLVQSLDEAILRSLDGLWREENHSEQAPDITVNSVNFAEVFMKIHAKIEPQDVVNGFSQILSNTRA